jgi:hypothetical protein
MDVASYQVTTHILNDTLNFHPDSLYKWIGNMDSFEGDLWLAKEQLADSNQMAAVQTLNAIPSKYQLSSEQQVDLNNYSALANIVGVRPVYSLDSATLSSILAYDAVGGYSEGWAQAILSWHGAHYPPEYLISDGKEQYLKGNKAELEVQHEHKQTVIVHPNPAKGEVNFSIK